MQVTINDKDYDLNFGIGFLRELDKKYFIERNGAKFGDSMALKIPMLLAKDTVTLADILYTATHALKSRPSQKSIDAFIDSVEDIEVLFDEVIEELKKSNATKSQVAKLLAHLKKTEEELGKAEKEAETITE